MIWEGPSRMLSEDAVSAIAAWNQAAADSRDDDSSALVSAGSRLLELVARGSCRSPELMTVSADGQPLSLDSLSLEVIAHLDRLGVERSDWVRVAKVGEEGGEVVGALIKRTQGRMTTADVLAELGDVFLSALGASRQLGTTPSEVIAQRWKQVAPRSSEISPAAT